MGGVGTETRVGNRQWPILCALADIHPEPMTAAKAWQATGLPTPGNGSMETIRRMVKRGLLAHVCSVRRWRCSGTRHMTSGCLVAITNMGLSAGIGPKTRGKVAAGAPGGAI